MKKFAIFTAAAALVFCLLLALTSALLVSRMRMGIESIAAVSENGNDSFALMLLGTQISSNTARQGREALAAAGYSSLPIDSFMGKLFSDGVFFLLALEMLAVIGTAAAIIMTERKKRIEREVSLSSRMNSALRGESVFLPENDGERELAKLFSEIERLNELRESSANELREYVENVAHEIKSPTSGILLNLDLMERSGMNENRLGAARQCAMRIDTYVQGLLSLARLRAGKVRFGFEQSDLLSITRETARELEANGISVEVSGSAAEVNCDRTRMKEAIRNLIVNASKHQPAGEPVRVELASNELEASVCVSDNGPGIRDDALIERYSVGNEDGSSFGIGLSLAKEVASRHSGRLIIRRPAQGAAIELVIPRFRLKNSVA